MIDKEQLWQDTRLDRVSPYAKLIYLYLTTCPSSNQSGYFKLKLSTICTDTALAMDVVIQCVEELSKLDLVKHEEGWWHIDNSISVVLFTGAPNVRARQKEIEKVPVEVIDRLSIPSPRVSIPKAGVGIPPNTNNNNNKNNTNKKGNILGNTNNTLKVTIENEESYSVKDFVEDFNTIVGTKHTAVDTYKKALGARLKDGFTRDQIKQAITSASKDLFLMGKSQRNVSGRRYLTPEYILRPAVLDKWTQERAESKMPEAFKGDKLSGYGK